MKLLKLMVVFTLVAFSVNAKNDKEKDKEDKPKQGVVAMPEPSKLPELLLCRAWTGWICARFKSVPRKVRPTDATTQPLAKPQLPCLCCQVRAALGGI
jgi:hypothetical protein